MEGLQNRVDSFSKAKRVKNSGKTSYSNIKWPHPATFTATPETLADAGFYFNPTSEDRDTVTCFICEKNLGGWEPEDDPLDLHWTKCGTLCCWATVRCGLRIDMDSDGGTYVFPDKDRLPTSTAMEQARLETFSAGKGWIHDKPKNHGASSLRMARAGFVFTPQEPGDDLATCLYCGVCLSGWESGDDPLEEHRKRDLKSKLNCPFFSYTEPTPVKPASKTKGPRSRQSSRNRTTSSQHQDLVLPLKDDTDNESLASTSKPKGGKARSSSRKLNRSQSRTTLGDVAEDKEDPIAELQEVEEEEEEAEKKPKKKAGKGKKSIAPSTKKRGRSKAATQAEEEDAEMEEPSPVEPTPSQTQDTDQGEEEATTLRKSTRGRRVTRAASVEIPAPTPLQKSTRGKKKQASVAPEPEPEPEDEPTQDTADEQPDPPKRTRGKTPAKTPKSTRKPSRTKAKPTSAPPDEPEIAEEDDEELAAEAAAVEAVVLPSVPVGRRKSSAPSSKRQSVAPSPPPAPAPKPASKARVKPTPVSRKSSSDEEEVAKPVKAKPSSKNAVPFPSQPSPKPVEEDAEMEELPPLYIPKRGGKSKPLPATPTEAPAEQSSKPRLPSKPKELPTIVTTKAKPSIEEPKPKLNKLLKSTSTRSLASAAPSEISDVPDSDASEARKPLTKRLSKAPARKPSVVKQKPIKQESVVEISSDDDSEKEKTAKGKSKQKKEKEKERVPSDAKKAKPPTKETKEEDTDAMVLDSPPAKPQSITDDVEMEVSAAEEEKARSPSPEWVATQPVSSPPPEPPRGRSPSPAPALSPAHVSPKETVDSLPVKSSKKSPSIDQPQPQTHVEDVKMASPRAPKEEVQQVSADPPHPEPPRTPPRQTHPPTITTNPIQPNPMQSKPAEADPLFYPPLSRLPFTKMTSLTDAELDMTVEDWIRYQVELEYDKFKRDGERELARFKKSAEEVRNIIEGL